MFTKADIIVRYTRAEAIADGVLIDLSELGKEAGFKYPIAITQGVNSILNNLECPGQDFDGRAWDALTILKYEIKRQQGDIINFAPLFLKKAKNGKIVLRPEKFYARCHAGDNLEPVITIMLIGED